MSVTQLQHPYQSVKFLPIYVLHDIKYWILLAMSFESMQAQLTAL